MKLSKTIAAAWKKVSAATLIILLAIISLGCWAFSTPIGGTPDEDFHLVSIWCGQGVREGLCEPSENKHEMVVPEALVKSAGCYAFRTEISAKCQGPLFGQNLSAKLSTDRGNFEGGYPPIFYWVMSWFASPNIYLSVFLMRAFNILFFIGVVVATYILTPRKLRNSFLLGLAVTVVPLGMFLIGSINPNSWAISLVPAAFLTSFAFAKSAERQQKSKYRILLGLFTLCLTVLGGGSRADTGIFVLFAIGIGLFVGITSCKKWKLPALLFALSGIISVVFFAVSRQGGDATTSLGGVGSVGRYSGSSFSLIVKNFLQTPDLIAGSFGKWGLGWLDTMPPTMVWFLGVAIFGAIFIIGIGFGKSRINIAQIVSLAAVWLVPVAILTKSKLEVGAGVQPRYILPLIILTATICSVSIISKDTSLISKTGWATIAIAVIVSNSLSLFFNTKRYATGLDITSTNLDFHLEWNWPGFSSPMALWLTGTISFAIVIFIIFKLMTKNVKETSLLLS